jgi:hypothetical protein
LIFHIYSQLLIVSIAIQKTPTIVKIIGTTKNELVAGGTRRAGNTAQAHHEEAQHDPNRIEIIVLLIFIL